MRSAAVSINYDETNPDARPSKRGRVACIPCRQSKVSATFLLSSEPPVLSMRHHLCTGITCWKQCRYVATQREHHALDVKGSIWPARRARYTDEPVKRGDDLREVLKFTVSKWLQQDWWTGEKYPWPYLRCLPDPVRHRARLTERWPKRSPTSIPSFQCRVKYDRCFEQFS